MSSLAFNNPDAPLLAVEATGIVSGRPWSISRFGGSLLVSVGHGSEGGYTFEVDDPRQGLEFADAIRSAILGQAGSGA